MKTLISANDIQRRITEMAFEIDEYYKQQRWYKWTNQPVVIISVLTGAVFFTVDLMRQLTLRTKLDFIRTSTYPGKSTEAQLPIITAIPVSNLHDAHVLIVEDILDTGVTLRRIQEHILWQYPETLKIATLLRKPDKAPPDMKIDFIGFDIPDEFVTGMGLDYDDRYRELPYISVLQGLIQTQNSGV
jgi:hypoxanthine phosphoribosyltransferase